MIIAWVFFWGEGAELFEFVRPVWYMCLKIENCCLKTFVKIRVGEKVR